MPLKSMTFTPITVSTTLLSRQLAALSVRKRLIILAVVPLLGFLASGLTYVAGEDAVGSAFETVKRSTRLADASRDFKGTVVAQ
jgi:methyl-accepting chemotaxis protein